MLVSMYIMTHKMFIGTIARPGATSHSLVRQLSNGADSLKECLDFCTKKEGDECITGFVIVFSLGVFFASLGSQPVVPRS